LTGQPKGQRRLLFIKAELRLNSVITAVLSCMIVPGQLGQGRYPMSPCSSGVPAYFAVIAHPATSSADLADPLPGC
jgi:hypothetical protein